VFQTRKIILSDIVGLSCRDITYKQHIVDWRCEQISLMPGKNKDKLCLEWSVMLWIFINII
jgi:hypothetical protein